MRQRKDESAAADYIGKQMETPIMDAVLPELTVAELLARWPQAIPVFLHHQMACVGCTMAPFETLADAAASYGIPLSLFIGELQETIRPLEDAS